MADKKEHAAGTTAILYRGRHFPVDTKDLDKAFEQQKKDEADIGQQWPEAAIPGTSGSGEEQPKGGVVNDDSTAKKSAKAEEKSAEKASK